MHYINIKNQLNLLLLCFFTIINEIVFIVYKIVIIEVFIITPVINKENSLLLYQYFMFFNLLLIFSIFISRKITDFQNFLLRFPFFGESYFQFFHS